MKASEQQNKLTLPPATKLVTINRLVSLVTILQEMGSLITEVVTKHAK